MPAKNSSKEYVKNGYYHLYNRGVEKRNIFLDQQDYNVFLSYLNNYLSVKNDEELFKIIQNPDSSLSEKDKARKLLRLNNFSNNLLLLAYGLMQNHFHFLVKQLETYAIDSFMNSIGTRYTMYFNRKYNRIGSLYQGVYKAVLVNSDEQLLHLSRYIHDQAIQKGQPSSYPEYMLQKKTDWVYTEEILSFFSKQNPNLSYQFFVNQNKENELIYRVIIEDEIA